MIIQLELGLRQLVNQQAECLTGYPVDQLACNIGPFYRLPWENGQLTLLAEKRENDQVNDNDSIPDAPEAAFPRNAKCSHACHIAIS